MTISLTRSRIKPRPPVRRRFQLETLEARCVLSANAGAFFDLEPNETADVAQNLPAAAVVQGAIGNAASGAADVDWYSLQLDEPSILTVSGNGATSIGLYVAAPFDFADRFAQSGVRLHARTDVNHLQRPLAAGSYLIAVSGAGNDAFHPFIAGSGLDGATGDYQFEISTEPLAVDPTAGPKIIAADPAENAILSSSPFVLRFTLSAALNPDSASAGDTVRLLFNATGDFGDGSDQDIALDYVHYSDASGELQLTPSAPLLPGFYQVVLVGDFSTNFNVLTNEDGVPFGADADHPDGQDVHFAFQITANEGDSDPDSIPDDTATGAHELGDISSIGLVQQTGAIGDDARSPFPGADVDMYHFQITGPGRYAVVAEIFARRLGSPLDPGVSLFRLDSSDSQLHLIAGNDNTMNDLPASNGKNLPLLADSLVTAGLTAGDYYVVVSSRGNVPDSNRGILPGVDGVFDPNVSRSGSSGFSRGPYLLNVLAQADDAPPTVVSVSSDTSGSAAPTQFVVRFSEAVNLQQLAFTAFEQSGDTTLEPVYVETATGGRVYPRLLRFDSATHEATFLMLDRLPSGTSTLHLSGSLGLADFAGNPLVGDDATGDFSAAITVDQGNSANDEGNRPQEIGVLFPHELRAGVVISRDAADQADSADYRIQLLQDQTYFFFLTGTPGLQLHLFDADGKVVPTSPQGEGGQLALIRAGSYVVEITGGMSAKAGQAYQLRITLGGAGENPPPLNAGPAPLIRTRLSPAALPETPTPQVILPGAISTIPAVRPADAAAPPSQVVLASTGTATSAPTSLSPPPLATPFVALAAGPISGVPGAVRVVATVAIDRVVLPGSTPAASVSLLANPIPALLLDPSPSTLGRVGMDFAAFSRGIIDSHRLLSRLWTTTVERIFADIDPNADLNDAPDEELFEDTADLFADSESSLPLLFGGFAALQLRVDARPTKSRKRRLFRSPCP
jgi:hypothetical protein